MSTLYTLKKLYKSKISKDLVVSLGKFDEALQKMKEISQRRTSCTQTALEDITSFNESPVEYIGQNLIRIPLSQIEAFNRYSNS